ncbi:hypothetical protein SO802_022395 [Lithocarpus litseifolius]|uniref:Thiol methyltransferase 2 n=1 Tax=Lithocarpus litseifolius TaxID=425828 RepID=A0AAW2CKG6_9ROSI
MMRALRRWCVSFGGGDEGVDESSLGHLHLALMLLALLHFLKVHTQIGTLLLSEVLVFGKKNEKQSYHITIGYRGNEKREVSLGALVWVEENEKHKWAWGVCISLGYGLSTMDLACKLIDRKRGETAVSQFGHYAMQSLSHSRLLDHTNATALIPFRNLPSIIRTFWSTNAGIRGTKPRRMEKRDENQKSVAVESTKRLNNPRVDKLQQLVHKDSTDGWEKSWEQGVTPWDLGQPTPILVHLHQTGALPKGRALVPGCGSGYDVAAIACPERYVVGLDISDIAIKKAVELSSPLPNASYFNFLKADFFTWSPSELFDLIFDYTFFCAIEPDMRLAWAQRIRDILKPGGELITLMFPISDHVGGPPFKVSISDYEEVLLPMGFRAVSIVDNELAIGPRKGREKLGRWKRSLAQCSL